MEVPFLRTSDKRFQSLPDFPYQAKYLDNGNLRMAYIDESFDNGGTKQDVFLCLHGQPTWSFLYRRMIPILLRHTTKNDPISRRVIAPDLFGFGRSDKPTDESVYTFHFHRNSLLHLVRALDLQNITLVVQDWGGLLGLTLPVDELSRFKRLIVMNTALAVGEPASKGFTDWRSFNNRSPDMKIGQLMGRSCKHISEPEKEAYDAPYPDARYKSGVRRFPNLVMTDPSMPGVEDSKKAISLYGTTDQFKTEDIFMAWGPEDPMFGGRAGKVVAKMWKNGCFYTDIEGAGHFVQEWGDQVALRAIHAFENPDSPTEVVEKISPRDSRL